MIKKLSLLSGVDEYRALEPVSANIHDGDLFMISLSGTPGYPFSSEGWATANLKYSHLVENISNSLSSFQNSVLSTLYDYVNSKIDVYRRNFNFGYVNVELRYAQNDNAGDLYDTWFGIGFNNIVEGTLYRSVSTNDEYVFQAIYVDNITTLPVPGEIISGANGVGTVFEVTSAGAGPTYEIQLKTYSGYFVDNEIITGNLSANCLVAGQNCAGYIAVYQDRVYKVDAIVNYNAAAAAKVAIQHYNPLSGTWVSIIEQNAYNGIGSISAKFKASSDGFIRFAMKCSASSENNLGRLANIDGEDEIHATMVVDYLGIDN